MGTIQVIILDTQYFSNAKVYSTVQADYLVKQEHLVLLTAFYAITFRRRTCFNSGKDRRLYPIAL